MRNSEKATSGKIAAAGRNYAMARKIALLGFAVALFALPQQARAARTDTITVVTKSVELTSDGDKYGLRMDFDKNKWRYCIIKYTGFYHKDIRTETASQKFIISVNGKVVINEDCLGEKIYRLPLEGSDQKIRVEGRMERVHGAIHAKGSVEVKCLTEMPNVFYVSTIEYDTKNAVRTINPPLEVSTVTKINDSKQTIREEATVKYHNRRSVTWQASSSHAEHFGFSVGYKPSSDQGGIEGKVFFEETIHHDYSKGETEEISKEQEFTSKFKLKPKEKHRMFVMQGSETWEIPYTMTGYMWDEDGVKTYDTIKDKYVFKSSTSNTIMHEDPDDVEKPAEVMSVKNGWQTSSDL